MREEAPQKGPISAALLSLVFSLPKRKCAERVQAHFLDSRWKSSLPVYLPILTVGTHEGSYYRDMSQRHVERTKSCTDKKGPGLG